MPIERIEEFTSQYRIVERHYLDHDKHPRVKRTVYVIPFNGSDETKEVEEDYPATSIAGEIRSIVDAVNGLGRNRDNPPKYLPFFDSPEERQYRATLWLIAATVVAIVLTVLRITLFE